MAGNFVPHVSRSPWVSIQDSSDSFPIADVLLVRGTLILATFIVRTLMPIGQKACLARTLEIQAIDACCIQWTRSQGDIRLTSLWHLTVWFNMLPEETAFGHPGIRMALCKRAGSALLD